MGQDYVARKSAKRNRKRVANDGARPEGVRQRKKNGPRRLCKGLCYSAPQLTEEDKQWRGEEEDDADAPMGGYDSEVEEAVQQQKQQQQQQASAATTGAPAKKKMKLSTAIPLLTAAQLSLKPSAATAAANDDDDSQPEDPLAALTSLAASTAAAPAALAPFHPLIQAAMRQLKFTEPTPVQAAVWQAACSGSDVQAVAEPGTGKTLAYLLPALVRLQQFLQQQNEQAVPASIGGDIAAAPLVLVLAPSRELAKQVWGVCRRLYATTKVSSAVVYGGVGRAEQLQLLHQRKPLLLVATPGRLLDLAGSSSSGDGGSTGAVASAGGLKVSLERVQLLVLDEADKMLSVGFMPQLKQLAAKLRLEEQPASTAAATVAGDAEAAEHAGDAKKKKKKRKLVQQQQQQDVGLKRPQVLLLTATLAPEVQQVASSWLREPLEVRVNLGADAISKTITQVVQVCAEHKKPAKLLKHLAAIQQATAGQRQRPQVIVFANRIKTVRFVHSTLQQAGYQVTQLHGQRSQPERTAALMEFKSGKAQVLVASDVAARGLDIHGLPYVVNYDFPGNLDTYIHRVGRTGRLGAHGHAFSFLTRNMAKLSPDLVQLLQHHEQSIDPNLLQLAEAWQQVQAVLQTTGGAAGAAAGGAAEAEADDEEEQEEEQVATADAGGQAVPEDLHEGLAQQKQPKGSSKKAKQQQQGGGGGGLLQELTPEGFEAAFQAILQQQELQQGGEDQDSEGAEPVTGKGSKKKKTKLKEQAVPSSSTPAGVHSKGAGSRAAGDELLVPRALTTAAAATAAGGGRVVISTVAAAVAVLPPGQEFQPSNKFAGARPGYVFKKGTRGLGYYWDAVAAKAAAAPRRAAPILQQQQQQQQGGGKARTQQPLHAAAAGGRQQAAQKQQKQHHKRKAPAGDSSSSDDEGGSGGKHKRHRALPGRLRKKLAKDRAGGQAGRGGKAKRGGRGQSR